MMENNKIQIAFASINKNIVENVPVNVSKIIPNKDFVAWGEDNKYPEFLYQMYNDSSTLHSIINGVTDYVLGDDIIFDRAEGMLPEDIKETFELAVKDYVNYGICYINVLKNYNNQIIGLKTLDCRNVRTNKDNNVFFYSEDWNKSYGRIQAISLPLYLKDGTDSSSILVVKNNSRSVYPVPIWGSCVESVMTDIEIKHYHLNEIKNGFSATCVLNFNNGVPTDEDKDEIEKSVNQKFCGSENAGRFLLSFNKDKDSATTIEKLANDDFDDRYNALAKNVRQDIFTAFRANPNLFGIPTENLGFSSEEYESSFELFNKTVIKPIQNKLVGAFFKMGIEVNITPFAVNNKK